MRVLIHYSRGEESHDEQVLTLTQRLRGDGVDAWMDRFEPAPPQGWARWLCEELERADFVVLVCTPSYRERFERTGHSDGWFGLLVTQRLLDGQLDLENVVPVGFSRLDDESVPMAVRGATRHVLPAEYSDLCKRLTRTLAVTPAPLGPAELHTGMRDPPTLADEMAILHEQRKHLTLLGQDLSEVNEAILQLRRRLRDGPNLVAGEVLNDRYSLIERLGHGGFADVWKAWDGQRRGLVAIKVLHGQWFDDHSRVERFRRGAETMAEMHHEHIVPILSPPSLDEHHHYFVMGYFHGGDLGRAVAAGLARDVALRAAADAITGLAHVHAKGLVHRDVKPTNILLDEHQRGHLSDFDLVGGRHTTGGTRTGAALGTFTYAAPEQLSNAAEVDWRADVYSAGMSVLFVLLGKEPPVMVASRKPQIFEQLDCSDVLRDALRRAVVDEVDDRTITCEELVAAIRGDPTPTGRLELSDAEVSLLSTYTRKKRMWAAALVVGVVGVVVLASQAAKIGRPSHDLVLITGGAFDEHSVADFYLDRTEVTVAAYQMCVDADICSRPNTHSPWCNEDEKPNHPRNCISAIDADTFCNWVGGRLPTQVEWEWAARGRNEGRTYPWGKTHDEVHGVCWNRWQPELGTCEVGSQAMDVSIDGVLDLAANVQEWTVSLDGEYRLVGSSWVDEHEPETVSDWEHLILHPSTREFNIGFRCARDKEL